MHLPAIALLTAVLGAAPTGVWEGTIAGDMRLVACFEESGQGLYYYLRSGNDLQLTPEGSGWTEQVAGKPKVTGRWALQQPLAEKLSGTWSAPDGKATQPIALKRLAAGDEPPCQSRAYNQARVSALKLERSKATLRAGLSIREVGAPGAGVVAPELVEPVPSPLGLSLKAEFENALHGFFRCRSVQRVEAPGEDLAYRIEAKVAFASRSLLTVAVTSSEDCGVTQHRRGKSLRTFARATGQRVDPLGWLLPEYADGITPKSALAVRVMEGYDGLELACQEAMDAAAGWQVWPDAEGLRFRPLLTQTEEDCVEDALVKWKELQPFLGPEGRKLAAELAPSR